MQGCDVQGPAVLVVRVDALYGCSFGGVEDDHSHDPGYDIIIIIIIIVVEFEVVGMEADYVVKKREPGWVYIAPPCIYVEKSFSC